MKLVPITFSGLDAAAPIWKPFVESIAKRQRCHFLQRLHDVYSGQVRLILIVPEHEPGDEFEAKALLGVSTMQRGNDWVARLVWVVGKDRHLWIGLLPELEQMFRDLGYAGMEAIARPGWSRELKRFGYRLTHVQLEKDF